MLTLIFVCLVILCVAHMRAAAAARAAVSLAADKLPKWRELAQATFAIELRQARGLNL